MEEAALVVVWWWLMIKRKPKIEFYSLVAVTFRQKSLRNFCGSKLVISWIDMLPTYTTLCEWTQCYNILK